MKTRRRHLWKSSKAGFTILELLVAMTVLGLLMSLLFANIHSATKGWIHSEARFSETDEIRHIQILLRKQFEQIYPKYSSKNHSDFYVDFDGRSDSVQFLAPMPNALGSAGWAYIKISIVKDINEAQLIMTIRPELSWPDSPNLDPVIVVSHLKSAQFSYFGKDSSERNASWHNEWSNKQALPELVRLNANFRDSSNRIWPELVVAPRISVDAGCVYDPLTSYCQGR